MADSQRAWDTRATNMPPATTSAPKPRQADAITAAELERALADPDPLLDIAQLLTRRAASFVLNRDGVTQPTALHMDAFVTDKAPHATVDLAPTRESTLAELDLDDDTRRRQPPSRTTRRSCRHRLSGTFGTPRSGARERGRVRPYRPSARLAPAARSPEHTLAG